MLEISVKEGMQTNLLITFSETKPLQSKLVTCDTILD